MLTGLVTRYVLAKYVPAKLRSICSCGNKTTTKKKHAGPFSYCDFITTIKRYNRAFNPCLGFKNGPKDEQCSQTTDVRAQ